MEMVEEIMGEAVPLTNDGHLFCMSSHLKGVHNSKYSRRNAYMCLLSREHGILES